MTESTRRPSLIILLIILSLLLHFCFLVLFFLIKPQENEHEMPSISFEEPPASLSMTQKEPDPNGVAALKPRASNFGDPDTQDASQTQNSQTPAPSEIPTTQDEQPEVDNKTNEKAEDLKSSDETDRDIESQKTEHDGREQVESLNMINVQKNTETMSPRNKKRKKTQPRLQSQIYGADVQTRAVTFTDIAQGFIYSLRNEGNDWLKRDGDDSKRPDPVEMRYISYIQKVVWYLQNSFRQTEPKSWPDAQLAMSFKITLNKEGEITHTELLKPSGNDLLDAFTRKRIENAGPFPPLPDHFKRDNFQILLSFTVGDRRMPIIHGYIACV